MDGRMPRRLPKPIKTPLKTTFVINPKSRRRLVPIYCSIDACDKCCLGEGKKSCPATSILCKQAPIGGRDEVPKT